jgi:hypothetical protein
MSGKGGEARKIHVVEERIYATMGPDGSGGTP